MAIDGKTKIFGIIGYPVAHSLSPAMHNAAFRYLGVNAVYLPFEVKPKDLEKALSGIRGFGICGMNVTIPHKDKVIKYLDGLSDEAKLIGAVNTIVNRNNRLVGYNTDTYGFVKSLKEDLRFEPKKKNIVIIGAGGAAKAVAFGLALKGANRIILTDKVDERALELACEVELKTRCECIALKIKSPGIREMILNSQLLVNATPVGMKRDDPIATNPDFLHRGLCIFDLVYNNNTKLLAISRQMGLKAIGGLNMLLYQGARAFELWTGKRPPIGIMRKALKERKV